MAAMSLAEALRSWSSAQELEFDLELAAGALAACGDAGITGTFVGVTSWMTWRVWFVEGRLCQCECGPGDTTHLRGPMALWALLVTRGLTGRLEAGTVPSGEGFGGAPTPAVLAELHRRIDERRNAGLDVDRFALNLDARPVQVRGPATPTVDPLAAPLLQRE